MRKKILMAACILTVVLCSCGQKEDVAGKEERQESVDGQQKEMAAGETALKEEFEREAAVMETSEQESESTTEDEMAQEPVHLAGSSLSILGDSISTYQGYNPLGYYAFFPEYGGVKAVEDTWWQIVAEDLELTLYVNGSSSGATCAGDSTGTEDPQCACNDFRTNDLAGPEGACPDRIIVYLGTNDLLQTIPLGNNDGTGVVMEGEVATFSDAYTLMIDKLQANYPQAEIYCCTLLQVGDYGTQTPYVEFVNGAGLTAADYGEVIARIAESKGLPVIDLYDCGITVENLQEMTGDGVHPTVEGMRRIAEAVKECL